MYKRADAAAAVTGFGLPSAARSCVAQGGGSLCVGVALVLGVLDTSLQCVWRVRRRNGAGVGNARLRAVMLWTEEVVCNEYTVDGNVNLPIRGP